MLGVFANVPAYDDNFKKFLKKNNYCQTFNKTSLKLVLKILISSFHQYPLMSPSH